MLIGYIYAIYVEGMQYRNGDGTEDYSISFEFSRNKKYKKLNHISPLAKE